MGYRDELENLGVNVAEGVDRVMGDEPLYEMMLGMFIDTVNENEISLEEFDQNDTEALISKVHILKGMTGNLSLTPIYERYLEILGMLRGGRNEEAKAVMKQVIPIQEKIMDCIKNNQG